MQFAFSIVQNLAFLSVAGMGAFFIHRYRARLSPSLVPVLLGLTLGITTFLVTIAPLKFPGGATVDARAGPIIVSAVLAGPVGAAIAAVMGGLARTIVGGGFMLSGVLVYAIYGLLGWVVAQRKWITLNSLGSVQSFMILSSATFVGAGMMFFVIQPRARAIEWLINLFPSILLANALSVLVIILVLRFAIEIVRNFEQTDFINNTLQIAKRAGGFGIWDFDIKKNALKWDVRSREIHGLPPSDDPMTYEDWVDLVHPEDRQPVEALFERALQGDAEFEAEFRIITPQNTTKHIKGGAVILRDAADQPFRAVGTNTDITPLRNTEEDLLNAREMAFQSQKFDSIGKLTGGVAHDFNNLLAILMGNLELLRDEIETGKVDKVECNELIQTGIEAIRRGSELTDSMLSYARQARLQPSVINMNQIVRETETMMRRTIESRIEIETVLQGGIWPIEADRSSLQSAVVNLIVNARDAMDGGGRLTIETANVRIDESYLDERSEPIPAGRYAMLAISDDGQGIPSDVLDKIFDPFFTTKPVGKGTGLGLSMVHGFVRQSGGTVRVYSEPGQGTSFKLYFPALSSDTAAPARPRVAEHTGENKRPDNKRVLVAEDRDEVMKVLNKTLVNAGYDVTLAGNGDAAFTIFRGDPTFDLVVTDIVMPGTLQGPSLAKACRSIRPDTPFIFLSGYASEATVHGNGLLPEDVRLMKPVSRDDLLRAVETRLNQPGTA